MIERGKQHQFSAMWIGICLYTKEKEEKKISSHQLVQWLSIVRTLPIYIYIKNRKIYICPKCIVLHLL